MEEWINFYVWQPTKKHIHLELEQLTHWGPVTHICVGNLTIIGLDNGLSPGRRQAIIWINAGILLIGPWGTNFSEILIYIHTFSFKKIHFKMPSAKWRPFCLGLNVLSFENEFKHRKTLIRPNFSSHGLFFNLTLKAKLTQETHHNCTTC